jgi:microcystin degradation protein MlrC
MTRIAIARLWHEGNSFSPVPTRLADFRRKEWTSGKQAEAFYRGSRTELGAAVDFFAAQKKVPGTFLEPAYLRCAAAGPGGPVDEADLRSIVDEIVAGIAAAKPDALYLSLHGALIGTGTLTADLALLEAARGALGNKPLAVSFDLHANLDPRIADFADIVVGYKTHSHVDMYETGLKALQLLYRATRKEIGPKVSIVKIGAVLPSINMRTSGGPMAEMEALAAKPMPGILDATPFGGFAYGDSPCAGASIAVTADGNRGAARARAAELAGEMLGRRAQFDVSLPSAMEGFTELLTKKNAKPAAILEPSDNPLSGGVGDTTGLLRALLERGKYLRAVFAFFCDPGIVAQAHAKSRLSARIGGRFFPPAVPLEVEVERLTGGQFRNAGPMEKGLEVNLGRTAVLRFGTVRIIVTESCQAPNDPEYFRLHGIDLGEVDLVCAKAKNHSRAAFGAVFDPIIDVDTPGPAAANLSAMPFRHVPRELLPR